MNLGVGRGAPTMGKPDVSQRTHSTGINLPAHLSPGGASRAYSSNLILWPSPDVHLKTNVVPDLEEVSYGWARWFLN